MRERLERWLGRRELSLNRAKTRELNANEESFVFLGWQVTPRHSKGRQRYCHMEPSPQNLDKLMDQIRRGLNHVTQWRASTELIAEINSVRRGWSGYFRYGHGRDGLGQIHDLISARRLIN